MATSARLWRAEHRKQRLAQLTVDRTDLTRVRYEDLCRDPTAELKRICRRLGVEFQPDMLRFRAREMHRIGGNAMRFRDGESEIRLDEAWRRELSSGDRAEFARIAGRLNRALGYEA